MSLITGQKQLSLAPGGQERARAQAPQAPGGAAGAAADPATQAKLKKACQMFEAQFLKQLWKEMRKSIPKNGLIYGGQGEEMFTDMLDQAVSDKFVAGGSMGIATMLEEQLGRQRLRSPHRKGVGPLRGAPSGQTAQEMEASLAQAGEAPPASAAAHSWTRGNIVPPLGSYGRPRAALGDYQPPVQGVVTSGFGPRVHPITGEERDHHGLDLAAPAGTPVSASRSGVVSFAGGSGDYGNLVVLEHPDGSSTYYGHLQSVQVKPGQKLDQGQQLGTVGSTGLATGPHLHFEVRDRLGQPVDPQPLLAKGLNLAT